ncbi:MAG: hypothetical protein K2M79_04375 [Muribaculaceae bacterium]|nr:hypothetical protein [Muribaculaceae bacterium]
MHVIADSSSTRTEWTLVNGSEIVEHAFTTGINPYFQSRREISHAIRLELPEVFFRGKRDHVFFYGAGCATPERCKIVSQSLVAQFKTPVTVNSDLLGAARGLLVRKPGLACILGTGSNSCVYDGNNIQRHVRALGYVLGDEGSGAYMGKCLVADILKDLAPVEIREGFYEYFAVTANALMESIYSNPLPNRTLARYATYLATRIQDDYAHELVYNSLMAFFRRNIAQYDYKSEPVNFVGSVAVTYKEILQSVASDFGATVGTVTRYSMPGLINYHADEN